MHCFFLQKIGLHQGYDTKHGHIHTCGRVFLKAPGGVNLKDPFERLWNLPDYVELKDQELICTLCTVRLPTVTQMYMHLQGNTHHKKARAAKLPDVIWIQARNQLERLGSPAPVFPLPTCLTFTFWTEVLTFSTLTSNENAIKAFFLVVFVLGIWSMCFQWYMVASCPECLKASCSSLSRNFAYPGTLYLEDLWNAQVSNQLQWVRLIQRLQHPRNLLVPTARLPAMERLQMTRMVALMAMATRSMEVPGPSVLKVGEWVGMSLVNATTIGRCLGDCISLCCGDGDRGRLIRALFQRLQLSQGLRGSS